jgi:hypothetical protein
MFCWTKIMTMRTAIVLLALTLAGCGNDESNRPVRSNESVYQVVLIDLATKHSGDTRFNGNKIWLAPTSHKGDSLALSWGSEIVVDEELQTALQSANKNTIELDPKEIATRDTKIKEIESFIDLFYYRPGNRPDDAKCLVQFWQAGFTGDGKRAIVRFFYGPSPHGATGTYILEQSDHLWHIISSTITYYA